MVRSLHPVTGALIHTCRLSEANHIRPSIPARPAARLPAFRYRDTSKSALSFCRQVESAAKQSPRAFLNSFRVRIPADDAVGGVI